AVRIVRIEIERFMGLRRVDVALNPALQIIAGPNNAGKTTIFRALEFFFAPETFDYSAIKPQNIYFGDEGPRALTRVRVTFGQLTDAEFVEFGASVRTRSRTFWIEVRVSRAGRVSYEASRNQP